MSRFALSGCACVVIAVLPACKRYVEERKGETNVQPSTVPANRPPAEITSTPTPPPGSNPPTCPAGYTANTYPAWCIKLPKGYGAGKMQVDGRNMGHIDYTSSPEEVLRVFFTDAPMPQVITEERGSMGRLSWNVTGQGQLDRGRVWVEGKNADRETHFDVVAPGRAPFTLKCEADGHGDATYKRGVEACKTLFVP